MVAGNPRRSVEGHVVCLCILKAGLTANNFLHEIHRSRKVWIQIELIQRLNTPSRPLASVAGTDEGGAQLELSALHSQTTHFQKCWLERHKPMLPAMCDGNCVDVFWFEFGAVTPGCGVAEAGF